MEIRVKKWVHGEPEDKQEENVTLPDGVMLEKTGAGRYDIVWKDDVIGMVQAWKKALGGVEWESRGVGHCLCGEYDTAQEALNASLRDSGIIQD